MHVTLSDLLNNNQYWAQSLTARDPDYFPRLSKAQSPKYLWIGCSDSRVPANEVVGVMPGELFVHRNVANMVVSTDMNLLSVLQFAVDVLRVEHIIVCGHYGCGGVKAALSQQEYGLIDNWLRPLKGMRYQYREAFEGLTDKEELDLLCQINVKRQVTNVCHTTIVQNAWYQGRQLSVHGWIYDMNSGLIEDLGVSISNAQQLASAFIYSH
ncbi:carbonate dehydratase [Moraxella catarrhalis]|uniref:Carbonic anhydrase n=2 Tax=Moraxella catarrhalis TaxID=480 RepID=A0A3A9L997_MORCA|nr:carbonate dehydratase [Moraxella catarrhalis]ADG61012.1 carbonic anhydrase [Moraxella catarrhalis BBH18]AIK00732.1 carbonic anhydrase family protein [Moraxella catarrhalis]AIT43144.1 Carbonic anhydrase 2 [Moraxella catarrhalis]ARB67547.1 carbonate dehydratase [Moraxella catarrhalis]ARE66092.1 carbonic anhydrase [Moraxella catarrhalis]